MTAEDPVEPRSIRSIQPADKGKLVVVEGVVTAVEAKTLGTTERLYVCSKCGKWAPLWKPAICRNPDCRSTGPFEGPLLHMFVSKQWITVQEHDAESHLSQPPQSIDCLLEIQQVDTVKIGDTVQVVGEVWFSAKRQRCLRVARITKLSS